MRYTLRQVQDTFSRAYQSLAKEVDPRAGFFNFHKEPFYLGDHYSFAVWAKRGPGFDLQTDGYAFYHLVLEEETGELSEGFIQEKNPIAIHEIEPRMRAYLTNANVLME